VAFVEVPEKKENEFESSSGELVEVYVSSRSAGGVPLLFEVYFDDSVVRVPEQQFLLGMIPVLLGAGAVLQGAQLIPGIRLAQQVQKHQRERRAILQQAIAAGERERMRLAATLHDDIIQDLAGLAYVLEPLPELGPTIAPGALLQETIGKLRGITTELYSSPITADELPRALGILAERARSHGIRTLVQIDKPLPLDDRQSTMFHRIARESVQNVIKHSKAKNMEVHLVRLGRNWDMKVKDDGVGFGISEQSGSDHFGLRLMSDFAETAGAHLDIVSTLDKGTSIGVRIPTTGSTVSRNVDA
jgi:signal transduction histidine kinase